MKPTPSPRDAGYGGVSSLLVRPFQEFFRLEASGGLVLMICAVTAIVWANSPLAERYFGLWQIRLVVGFGGFEISKAALLWINDGLMAIFFFVVGLEIKRELLGGELASPRQAALPIAAAVGGMIVPALFYLALNGGTPQAGGWGVPMATDIAFALGVLALLGRRVPLALKIFLTAVAIVDDLGAVLVIALFYTAQISWGSLGIGLLFLVASFAANRIGIRRTAVYVVLGLGLWVAFLKSGVHATLAGVLLAFTIPSDRRIDARSFLEKSKALLHAFMDTTQEGEADLTRDQQAAVHSLEVACRDIETPLQRMEHALHGWVAFGIMPLFALANAGVRLPAGGLFDALANPVTLGVVVGLVFGKQIGVTLFAWLAVRRGWAVLPTGVSWRQVYGAACLAGIGFTMSLFIAGLAFDEVAALDGAKVGILVASVVSGVIGWILLATAPAPGAGTPDARSGTDPAARPNRTTAEPPGRAEPEHLESRALKPT